MAITTLKATEPVYTYGNYQAMSNTDSDNANANNANSAIAEMANKSLKAVPDFKNANKSQTTTSNGKNDQNFTKEQMNNITNALNKFVQSLNAKIHFKFHEASKEFMVQVVDDSTHEVLKEIPSHEMLDTIAAVRERIGVLLDKRI